MNTGGDISAVTGTAYSCSELDEGLWYRPPTTPFAQGRMSRNGRGIGAITGSLIRGSSMNTGGGISATTSGFIQHRT